MKKQLSLTLAAIMLAGLTACGTSTPAASSEATAPASSESEATAEEPSADSELDATVDEAEQALSDIGSIDVDKGLFDVTITFPADFATDITQEEIDQQVADGKFHSGQINEDGSVTYVMSKDQHKAIVDGISESIQSTLDGMVGTEDYPNFTAIDHNEDYTSFTVKTTTKPGEPAISDSMSVLIFAPCGQTYGIVSGDIPANLSRLGIPRTWQNNKKEKRPTTAIMERFDRSACPQGGTIDPAIVLYHLRAGLSKCTLKEVKYASQNHSRAHPAQGWPLPTQ